MDDRLAKRRYRIGRRMFTAALTWLRYWMIGGLLGSLALTAVLAAAGADLDTGAWRVTVSVAQWFWGATAGVWLYAILPVHIANGVTRREITTAFAVFGGLITLASGALAVTGFLAEHALLELLGQPLDTWGGALASGARYLLITPVYFFGGAAIGALAMRLGKGPVFVPLVLVGGAALYTAALFLEFYELGGRPQAVAAWAGGAIALTAALVAAYAAALRSTPIRPRGA